MHYTGHKQPMVSRTSTDHHRNSSREVWFTGTQHTSWGPPGKVKAECKQEDSEELGYVPWLESVGGELCGSQTRVRLVNSNPKSGVQSRGFIWGAHRHVGAGRQLLTTRAVEKPSQNSYFLVTLELLSRTHTGVRGLLPVQGLCSPVGLTKWMPS